MNNSGYVFKIYFQYFFVSLRNSVDKYLKIGYNNTQAKRLAEIISSL